MNCLQSDIDCETNCTFKGVEGYANVASVPSPILENVKEQLLTSDESEISDCLHVIRCLAPLGYFAIHFLVEASERGSLAVRCRLYIIGVKLAAGMDKYRVQLKKFADDLLASTVIGSGNPEHFINLTSDVPDMRRFSQCKRADPKWTAA